jgi:hypothetical protein
MSKCNALIIKDDFDLKKPWKNNLFDYSIECIIQKTAYCIVND